MIKVKFFTIADYEEEEAWLRTQHNKGLRLVDIHFPFFYVFEKCTPKDIIYRLDYQNCFKGVDYMQMFGDFGWEHITSCTGFIYFRKSANETSSVSDEEIFSDNISKLNMLLRIIKTRMLPILISFAFCVLPCYLNAIVRDVENGGMLFRVLTVVCSVLFGMECGLITYCGLKFRRLRKKYEGKD